MNSQNYLIDTNVFIGLEDDRQVSADIANFLALANRHGVGVFVHEAAKEDIARDNNQARRAISLSKIAKFQILKKVRGLDRAQLQTAYGTLAKPNDVVDATLLQALDSGAIDFLITEDRGLHGRARQHAAHLSRRILFIADAASLLISTFEPVKVPFRYVEEVAANEIPLPSGCQIWEVAPVILSPTHHFAASIILPRGDERICGGHRLRSAYVGACHRDQPPASDSSPRI